MNEALDRLARAYGIEPDYISERGEHCIISDATKRSLLAAMDVAAARDADVEASLANPQLPHGDGGSGDIGARCFLPDWLAQGRVWGITCQLYGVRSARNAGVGDFADLARLGELAAQAGADFIGVNPLHALFFADAGRYSPYAPSSRLFLNPFYIAVDRLPHRKGATQEAMAAAARATRLVDYQRVAHLKREAFESGYEGFCASSRRSLTAAARAFKAYCTDRGQPLQRFALYEALSEALVARGHYSGWHTWPAPYRSVDSHAVRRFERENADRITFHKWLQWVAESQLRAAQEQCKAAGMRIGLYLDLAVGVAPDGADTWAQPGIVVDGARIGCPPDMFNDNGQDWGLAPYSPAALKARDFAPFEAMLRALMRCAGAVRIDHAMGLTRLFWIPADSRAANGAYVRFPSREMLKRLSQVSQDRRAVVIGEDLGTVPVGFREAMSEVEIQGYRVFYFERDESGAFRAPHSYSVKALACLTTHDLPTIKGWWSGDDIDERERVGALTPANAATARENRRRDRILLLAALNSVGLLPESLTPALNDGAPCPADLPDEGCVAVHALLAKTASRLVAVQVEDLVGMREQANVPGTVDEHPNWRRKLPIELDAIPKTDLFRDITQALAQERPRAP